MASNPASMFGGGNSSLFSSSDYGIENGRTAPLSNVQQNPGQEVNPYYSGNRGRQAALMGNWRNPIGGRGTFFTQDDTPAPELPRPNPGSNFALEKRGM